MSGATERPCFVDADGRAYPFARGGYNLARVRA